MTSPAILGGSAQGRTGPNQDNAKECTLPEEGVEFAP
jgi:hypothetical protein